MEKFPKNTLIYFWYGDNHSSKKDGVYEVYTGSIDHWHYWPGKEPVSYIKVHAGFSIWLPVERLFLSEEECRSDLRNKLLKEILNEQFI